MIGTQENGDHTVEVIGAGLPRTATLTQKIALEMLGISPCYHMLNVVSDLSGIYQWSDALDQKTSGGQIAWSKIYTGFQATVDWPGAFFYQELMDAYPDAKVLLSVRDSEAWARSMQQTIWGALSGDTMLHDLAVARARIEPEWHQFLTLMQDMWARSGLLDASQGSFDTSALATAMERYNQQVRDYVPPERLLVWSPAQGWEPLCEFLGVPVPSAPLPRVNDSGSFVAMFTGDCMTALNRWYDQQYASSQAQQPSHMPAGHR